MSDEAEDLPQRREDDRGWVIERNTIQGNTNAFAQSIEAALPAELDFVLLLFPKGHGEGAAMAGRGTPVSVAKALKGALDSANRMRNRNGGRITLAGN
jgi:hypothetical protein